MVSLIRNKLDHVFNVSLCSLLEFMVILIQWLKLQNLDMVAVKSVISGFQFTLEFAGNAEATHVEL